MNALVRATDHLQLFQDPTERRAVELLGIQNREIVVASRKGLVVNMMTDQQRDMLVSALILEGLLKLGHKNQYTHDADLKIFSQGISNMIREKWSQFTETEVRLVFKMGVRGDFKAKPDEVVFLNEPNINDWFKAYRFQLKAEANLQKQKFINQLSLETKPRQMSEEEVFNMNLDRLETEIEKLIAGEPYQDFDLGNVLLKWLEGLGVINLTDAEKMEVLNKERQLIRSEEKNNALIDRTKKLSYKLFAEAVEGGTLLSGNPYEKDAVNRARKATFRGFVQVIVEFKEDVRTVVMEQLEANEREARRLSGLDEASLQKHLEFYHQKRDRHAAALVLKEQQSRNLTLAS